MSSNSMLGSSVHACLYFLLSSNDICLQALVLPWLDYYHAVSAAQRIILPPKHICRVQLFLTAIDRTNHHLNPPTLYRAVWSSQIRLLATQLLLLVKISTISRPSLEKDHIRDEADIVLWEFLVDIVRIYWGTFIMKCRIWFKAFW